MENKVTLFMALILCSATLQVRCTYYSETVPSFRSKEKVTHLHFYFFDIHTGEKPSAVVVARANVTGGEKKAGSFGTVYVIDNPLREGPEPTSKLIGNARGMYVSSSQEKKITLVMYVDYGFTTGEFNGSSISIMSRNPVTEPTRELAVIGGRGKFRLSRGYAEIRPHFLNATTGDGILEYNVTVLHY